MTRPTNCSICPLCHKTLLCMSQHLRRIHEINNIEERSILLKMASGRVNIRAEPCPLLGCSYTGSSCDKHLCYSHPELSSGGIRRHLVTLKRKVALRLLRELRATNPSPPLRSSLDEEQPDPGPPKSQRRFDCAGCSRRHIKIGEKRQEIRITEEELSKVRASYRLLHRRYERLLKKHKELSSSHGESEEKKGGQRASTSCSAMQVARLHPNLQEERGNDEVCVPPTAIPGRSSSAAVSSYQQTGSSEPGEELKEIAPQKKERASLARVQEEKEMGYKAGKHTGSASAAPAAKLRVIVYQKLQKERYIRVLASTVFIKGKFQTAQRVVKKAKRVLLRAQKKLEEQ